jgi:hypothetical protein
METLLTEIIGFSGTAKGFRLARRDRSCRPYFNMIQPLTADLRGGQKPQSSPRRHGDAEKGKVEGDLLLREMPSLGFAHFAFIRGKIAIRAIRENLISSRELICLIGSLCSRQVRADVEKIQSLSGAFLRVSAPPW